MYVCPQTYGCDEIIILKKPIVKILKDQQSRLTLINNVIPFRLVPQQFSNEHTG